MFPFRSLGVFDINLNGSRNKILQAIFSVSASLALWHSLALTMSCISIMCTFN